MLDTITPFITLKASRAEKRKLLASCAGAWANTELDNDEFWAKPSTKKSKLSYLSYAKAPDRR